MSIVSNHYPEIIDELNGREVPEPGHSQAFPDEDWQEYSRWSEELEKQQAEPPAQTTRRQRRRSQRTVVITFTIDGMAYQVYPLAIDPSIGKKAFRFTASTPKSSRRPASCSTCANHLRLLPRSRRLGEFSSLNHPKGKTIMNLQEAQAALAAVIPGSFLIGLDTWRHVYSFNGSKATTVEWKVFVSDNNTAYRAPTLEVAVAACLADKTQTGEEHLEDADRAILAVDQMAVEA
jgi:hypothetical protein